jgi:hypothetical protein
MIPLLILRSHLCCSCIEVGIFKLRTFGVSSIISCPVLSQCKPFPRIKSLIALLWYGRTPEVASRRCCGVNAVHVRGRSSVSREPRELGREPREHTDHLGPLGLLLKLSPPTSCGCRRFRIEAGNSTKNSASLYSPEPASRARRYVSLNLNRQAIK